ncbi:MAG: hypothetical protein V1848_00375 [Candidatus Magasanikbacteria bacterium]
MKYLIFLFSIFYFLIPICVHATIDQRCFTKDQCVEYNMTNGDMTREEANESFKVGTADITNACGTKDALGRDMGFCLPVVSTKTQVGFGQDNQFDNFGIFIQKMYKYGIASAILIGILMIIFAGLQWTASGGNPENITSAKKKIYGALGGITIAVLSYTILNTINSNLVQLKLPEVWLINQQGLSPVYCKNLQSGMLAQAVSLEDKLVLNGEANQIQALREQNIKPDTKYDTIKENAQCGFDYYVEGTGGMTCRGQKCQDGYVCYVQIPKHYTFSTNVSKAYNLTRYFDMPNHVMETLPYCREGTIGGIIYNSNQLAKGIMGDASLVEDVGSILTEWWGWPWIHPKYESENFFRIIAGCQDGHIETLEAQYIVNPTTSGNIDKKLKQQEYSLKLLNRNLKDANYCNKNGGLIGYALVTGFNESFTYTSSENHYIGKDGSEGIDLGDDTAFKYLLTTGNTNFTSRLFTAKDLEEGFMLNIDVDKVTDIDDEAGLSNIMKRREIYPEFF